jgi:hypothetical protein
MTKGELREKKNRYMGRLCCFQFVVKNTPLISASTAQNSELNFQVQGKTTTYEQQNGVHISR